MYYKVIIPILSIMILANGCASSGTSEVNSAFETSSLKETVKTLGAPVKTESEAEPGSMAVSSYSKSNENELSATVLDEYTRLFETQEYKDAYAYVARLNNMSKVDYSYDLIYVDDDDIPELVIDNPDYYVSMYSYKDGHVACYMDHWPYGAGGNCGYTYVPRKNIIFNSNYDYAGLIEYVTYGSIRENGTLETDYEAKYLYFNDVDGDGKPSSSEEDMMSADDYRLYEASYYNYTDQDMTDDEIKARIEKLDKYSFEGINGSLDYEELIKKLQ